MKVKPALFEDAIEKIGQYSRYDYDYYNFLYFDDMETDHYIEVDLVPDHCRFKDGKPPIYKMEIRVVEINDEDHELFKADFYEDPPNMNGNRTGRWMDISENPVHEDHAYVQTIRTRPRARMLLTAKAEEFLPNPDDILSEDS